MLRLTFIANNYTRGKCKAIQKNFLIFWERCRLRNRDLQTRFRCV